MLSSPAWPDRARTTDRTALRRDAAAGTAARTDRLRFAARLGRTTTPLAPGTAGTFLATLAEVAAVDVTLARTVEPHLDALGILAQAGRPAGDAVWGVFAAEGPGTRLDARADGDHVVLDGTKPWCSLAADLDAALVTAHTADGERGLFAVDLRHPGVTAHPEAWVARGMPDVPSGPVDFRGVPAEAVGEPGWYLRRPGFAWGGIGVAACWWGGAVGLARVLRQAVVDRPDPWLTLALGEVTVALADAEDAVAGAAARIDDLAGGLSDADWSLLAGLVRARVRTAVDTIVRTTTSALGPTPSATDEAYAARVADLELYVLQDHGRKDLSRLGERVAAAVDAAAAGDAAAGDAAGSDVVAW